jgi:hypothetical protein
MKYGSDEEEKRKEGSGTGMRKERGSKVLGQELRRKEEGKKDRERGRDEEGKRKNRRGVEMRKERERTERRAGGSEERGNKEVGQG